MTACSYIKDYTGIRWLLVLQYRVTLHKGTTMLKWYKVRNILAPDSVGHNIF